MTRHDRAQQLESLSRLSLSLQRAESCKSVLETFVDQMQICCDADGVTAVLLDTTSAAVLAEASCGVHDAVQPDELPALQTEMKTPLPAVGDPSASQILYRIPDTSGAVRWSVSLTTAASVFVCIIPQESSQDKELDQQIIEMAMMHLAAALSRSLVHDGRSEDQLRQIVEGFALALEAKDEMTHGHSLQVARFSVLVARKMGLSTTEVETIYHGGLLHDIGKIGLDDIILERLGILSRRERDVIQKHPLIGARLLKPFGSLGDVVDIILHHHERFDGSGYPEGLKGTDISIGARIVTVCDAFETMLAGRKHLRRLRLADAIINLKHGAGSHFDTNVVEALFRVVDERPELFTPGGILPRNFHIYQKNLKHPDDRIQTIFI